MELVLVLEQAVERSYGWFFPYSSKQFLETRDFDDGLAGNAPLFVDKRGHVQATGTAHALRYYVAEFEAKYQLEEWSSCCYVRTPPSKERVVAVAELTAGLGSR